MDKHLSKRLSGQLNAFVGPKHPALGKFTLWWLSIEGNSLKVKGSDKFEHGNVNSHSLLPLPFTANLIFLTFSTLHPGMFRWCYKVSKGESAGFLVASMAARNSVDVRYTLDRKELTGCNKIILRNTKFLSIPRDIASLLIVCARKHKFSCLSGGHPAGEEQHLHHCSKDRNVSPPS